MSVVQTAYPNFHDALVDGQVADTTTCDIDSYVLTGDDDVAFGRAVSRVAAEVIGQKRGERYTGARYAGIAIQDERLPASSAAAYKKGDVMSVIWRGDVAVKVHAAVAAGDDVVISQTTDGGGGREIGMLSSANAAANQYIALAGARFIRGAPAGGIAVVRLAGPAPV